jgi:hypothetical protein
MSSTPGFDFSKFVPGFDFLQNLAEQATQKSPKMPNLGHWVAPTINVEELEKRIEELKAVQFWLDQNAAALKATIQALEVQKMTLATLRGMNFSMGDLAEAFKIKTPVAEPEPEPSPPPAEEPAASAGPNPLASAFEQMQKAAAAASAKFTAAPAAEEPPLASAPEPEPEPKAAPAADAAKPAGVVDPLQWWNALATQFQQIAASAVSEPAIKKAVDDTSHLAANLAKEAFKGAEVFTQGVKDVAKAGSAVSKAGTAVKPQARPGVKPAAKSSAKPAAKTGAKPAKKTSATSATSAKKTASKAAAPAKKRTR